MKTNEEISLRSLRLVRESLEKITDWNHDTIHDLLITLASQQGVKNGIIMYPTRVALSGKAFTPGGAIELALIFGKQESLRRIDKAIELLTK